MLVMNYNMIQPNILITIKGPYIKDVRIWLTPPLPPCSHLHTSYKQCVGRQRWMACGWLTSDWCMGFMPHSKSHRQQTSSNLSGPFSTATAITVGVTRNAMQLHTSMASLSVILSCGHLHAIKPPLPLVRIWANPPSLSLQTSFMDDP